jgi:hypothetical protein
MAQTSTAVCPHDDQVDALLFGVLQDDRRRRYPANLRTDGLYVRHAAVLGRRRHAGFGGAPHALVELIGLGKVMSRIVRVVGVQNDRVNHVELGVVAGCQPDGDRKGVLRARGEIGRVDDLLDI